MSKQVLLISNMYPSKKFNFFGIFVKEFVNGLSLYDFDFSNKVVIKSKPKFLLFKLFNYLIFYFKIVFKFLFSNYDLIYIHFPTFSALPFVFLRYFVSVPVVLNFHGTDFLSNRLSSIILRSLLKPVFYSADLIVVPSNYFKNLVESKYPDLKTKLFISPSGGVDNTIFKPLDSPISNQIFKLGYVGRIDSGKGWETLVKAISICKERGEILSCYVVGSGAESNILKEFILNENLGSHIVYCGPLQKKDLPTFYKSLDLFVFPTLLPESLGLVGIEALSCGVPLLSSGSGAIKDYVKPNFNGLFFEPNNPIDLANKIVYCMKNPDILKSFRSNTVNSVECFSSNVVLRDLHNKLLSIYSYV